MLIKYLLLSWSIYICLYEINVEYKAISCTYIHPWRYTYSWIYTSRSFSIHVYVLVCLKKLCRFSPFWFKSTLCRIRSSPDSREKAPLRHWPVECSMSTISKNGNVDCSFVSLVDMCPFLQLLPAGCLTLAVRGINIWGYIHIHRIYEYTLNIDTPILEDYILNRMSIPNDNSRVPLSTSMILGLWKNNCNFSF